MIIRCQIIPGQATKVLVYLGPDAESLKLAGMIWCDSETASDIASRLSR